MFLSDKLLQRTSGRDLLINMRSTKKPDIKKVSQRDKMLSGIRELVFRDKKSFNSITIMDICKKANVSRKTFYRYFNNKYECLYEMGVNDLAGFEKLIRDIINKESTPVEKLKLLQSQLFKTFYEDFTENIMTEMRTEAPEFWKMNVNRYAEIINLFASVIEEGKRDGSFKKDTDSHLVIYLLCCASNSETKQLIFPHEQTIKPVKIESVFNIIFNGILNDTDKR